jgi:hypothetical protein
MGRWLPALQIDADVSRKRQSPDRDGHDDNQPHAVMILSRRPFRSPSHRFSPDWFTGCASPRNGPVLVFDFDLTGVDKAINSLRCRKFGYLQKPPDTAGKLTYSAQKPAELPVRQSTKFKLVINLKTSQCARHHCAASDARPK